MKKYRNNGAIGALLDEYEKALIELQNVLNTVTDQELVVIADTETSDPDCVSIQSLRSSALCRGSATNSPAKPSTRSRKRKGTPGRT